MSKQKSNRFHNIGSVYASFVRKTPALLLVITLVSQVFLAGPVRMTSAHAASVAPAGTAAEAFTLGQPTTSLIQPFLGAIADAGNTLKKVYDSTKMPEGLVIPNPLSASEKMYAAASSVLNVGKSPILADATLVFFPPPGMTAFDFDGDGKADIGRWRSANTEFKVKGSNSGTLTATTIGYASSVPAPADYDGDGTTDVATFAAGTWSIKQSSNGSAVSVTGFGQAGDVPFPGNWVGTTKVDEALYRPSNQTWYFKDGVNGNVTSAQFGASGDVPVAGNFDGDPTMDKAVYRPQTGYWYINESTAGFAAIQWGISTDVPFGADFDGDGKSDLGVFRASTGTWYILKSWENWSVYLSYAWGNYGDQPVPADYDGDGKADYAVWRPTTCTWFITKSSDSTWYSDILGVPGDRAIPSSFIKQVGSQLSGSEMAKLRMSPKNATGATNLYSQNFSWGTSLVGLPGRAGLDAGFGIGYNSLVWIKDTTNNAVIFDPDTSKLTPGFRFGFSDIEPAYVNSDTLAWSYMMVTPSGERKEFRQTAVSNVYETADSTYVQLVTSGATNPNDPVENISLRVTSTDGTQMN